MKAPNNIVQLAERLSHKSELNHKMSAIVFKNKRVINVGVNRYIGDGTRKVSLKRCFGVPYRSVHCEIDAIVGCSYKELMGASIYVHRKGGKKAKPCESCMHILQKTGIKNIIWSE